MGKAKRRKKLDPNYGKGNTKKGFGSSPQWNMVEELYQHLYEIGIIEKESNGEHKEHKATKALIEGRIPGWQYDLQKKIAYRIGQTTGLTIKLDFVPSDSEGENSDRPSIIDDLQQKAMLYLEQGNMPDFQQTVAQLKQLYPNKIEAEFYINQGAGTGNYEAAMKNFDMALWCNPYHALAYYNRGVLYSRRQDYQRAIEDFTLSIKLDPSDSDAYTERGLVYIAIGENQSALQDFERAIQINPNHAEAYLNRGCAYAQMGNHLGALVAYSKVIMINSRDADAYYNRGRTYRILGTSQEALNDLKKAANLYKQDGKMADYQDALNIIREMQQ
jgi:tetratricopeptide (TPR) repeat protein